MDARHAKYQRLIDFCKSIPPTPTAVLTRLASCAVAVLVAQARRENAKVMG